MALDEPRILEMNYTVSGQEAIHFLGIEAPPALSTPGLVNWMELTSRENVRALLNPGDDTVGVSVEIKHLAPTPVGMRVRVVSKLQQVEGRMYSFAVEAFDEVEKIAEATHTRAAVNVARFAARIAAKQARTGAE
jgi:fluoroacetyl-CoA thioesterase